MPAKLPVPVGERFGHWIVLGPAPGKGSWLCRCDCGVERGVAHCSLRAKTSRSCGLCQGAPGGPRRPLLSGQRFGRLVVLEEAAPRNGRRYWICSCDCGNEKTVARTKLITGNTHSCGCLRSEVAAKRARERNEAGIKHGLARNDKEKRHPLYWTWASMRKRCRDPNATHYARYGGRGISVCERWQDFENFLADMGEKPEWATGGIDRIDNSGDYELSNCRWSTREQQMANTGEPKAAA